MLIFAEGFFLGRISRRPRYMICLLLGMGCMYWPLPALWSAEICIISHVNWLYPSSCLSCWSWLCLEIFGDHFVYSFVGQSSTVNCLRKHFIDQIIALFVSCNSVLWEFALATKMSSLLIWGFSVLLEHVANSLGSPEEDIGSHCLFISSKRIVKIFVWADVATFLVQAGGGGLSANDSTAQTGSYVRSSPISKQRPKDSWIRQIALVGLSLQSVTYLLFMTLLIVFGLRVLVNWAVFWIVLNFRSTDGNIIQRRGIQLSHHRRIPQEFQSLIIGEHCST